MLDRGGGARRGLRGVSVIVSSLGFPRIGPRRELKHAVESYWAGKLDEQELLEQRAGSPHGRLGPPARRRCHPDSQQRLLLLRPRARHRGHGRRDPRPVRLERRRRSTSTPTSRSPAAAAGLPRARDDEVVRHQLPLPRPGTRGEPGSSRLHRPSRSTSTSRRRASASRPGRCCSARSRSCGSRRPTATGRAARACSNRSFPSTSSCSGSSRPGPSGFRSTSRAWCSTSTRATLDALRKSPTHALAEASPVRSFCSPPTSAASATTSSTVLALPVAGLHLDRRPRPEHSSRRVVARAPRRTRALARSRRRPQYLADRPQRGALSVLERVRRGTRRRLADDRPRPVRSSTSRSTSSSRPGIDAELRTWLAFAVQKLDELDVLGRGSTGDRDAVADELAAPTQAAATRDEPHRGSTPQRSRARLGAISPADGQQRQRLSDSTCGAARAARRCHCCRRRRSALCPRPPRSARARASFTSGATTPRSTRLPARAKRSGPFRWQEEIGLDVLVHGEFERNDMVQYFGEQLDGYAFTQTGWVQSYGSRCVSPPIIFGDVSRPSR